MNESFKLKFKSELESFKFTRVSSQMERPHGSCDQLLHARVPWHGDEFVAVMAERCNAIVNFDQL